MARQVRPTFRMEQALVNRGYGMVAGVDEVGRGPLAGPVMAAAVILPVDLDATWLAKVRDSKQVPAPLRADLCQHILGAALAVGIGQVSAQEIDRLGILPATRKAMAQAVASLKPRPDYVLVDAVPLPETGIPFKALIRGDQACLSIAAASIVAKVTRDHIMEDMDRQYPGYGLAQHKGYGTADHLECLRRLGPCPLHRLSFAPVRECAEAYGTLPEALPEARSLTSRSLTGSRGERLAREFLAARGYRIVETNYRALGGEIDIVAHQDGCLVFVEVRTRHGADMGTPAESVTPAKLRRLEGLAHTYLEAHSDAPTDWRIDVVAIDLPRGQPPSIELISGASL